MRDIEVNDPNAGFTEYRIKKSFNNRSDALDYEKNVLNRYKRRYGNYPGEGEYGGNKTNR